MKKENKISKKKISEFKLKSEYCIYCKEKFKDLNIYEDDDHKEDCCWKYYLVCLSCGKRNNLALLTDHTECNCNQDKT